jgi:hypothetical protein
MLCSASILIYFTGFSSSYDVEVVSTNFCSSRKYSGASAISTFLRRFFVSLIPEYLESLGSKVGGNFVVNNLMALINIIINNMSSFFKLKKRSDSAG